MPGTVHALVLTCRAVINFALAIDFSRPDGAVEEAVIRRYVDDVDLAIRAFGEPMRYFNRCVDN